MDCLTREKATESDKELFYSAFFAEPEKEENIFTPTNITGAYRRIIKKYLSSTKYSKTMVLSALNKEEYSKHQDPIVAVQRSTISPTSLGVMGGKEKFKGSLPAGLPGAEKYSPLDSSKYTHLQNLQVVFYIFTETLGEGEAIAYIIHQLLTAYGNDVLSNYTDAIKYVTLPQTSAITPDEKYTSKYIGTISVNVTFQDETVLLIRKNMIKYLRIKVSEEASVNIIASEGRN